MSNFELVILLSHVNLLLLTVLVHYFGTLLCLLKEVVHFPVIEEWFLVYADTH